MANRDLKELVGKTVRVTFVPLPPTGLCFRFQGELRHWPEQRLEKDLVMPDHYLVAAGDSQWIAFPESMVEEVGVWTSCDLGFDVEIKIKPQ